MRTESPMNPGGSDYSTSPHYARIDAALGHYAHAMPAPGLESRLAIRLSAAARQPYRPKSAWRLLVLQRVSVGALAAAAACAVVFGTVHHSQRSLQGLAIPVRSGGFGSSTAQHTPTQVTPATPQINPRAPRVPSHSRATVGRNQQRRAEGAAMPRSPYAPGQQPDAPQ